MSIKRLIVAVLVLTVSISIVVVRSRGQRYASHYENVLGTSMDLTVLASSEQAAKDAETAVLKQIDHDARILSGYERDSEFSRWSQTRGEAVPVSPELFEVLGLFDVWRQRTGGALDAAAERVSRVWQAAAVSGHLPSDTDLAAAVDDVRQRHWILDPVADTAMHVSATPVMLNSFTKSYIVDRAARAGLAVRSVRGVVVNIGGDLAVRGDWTESVRVTDPRDNADNAPALARLAVRNRAVATSGGYRRGFDIAGAHYSHIVDPRTGRPAGHVLSATVVAEHAVDAGALATALCVLTLDDSERLASLIPGVEYLMVLPDGQHIESRGWSGLEAAPTRSFTTPTPVARMYASEQTWNPEFELTVAVELARPGGMAKRPYVAVWIENKDRFPVRLIALWYQKSRYLPELTAWSRAERQRAMADGTDIISSVASATRSPGAYTFKWDGKDQQGAFVKPGTYTVCIEVSREHGTYQLLRQEMDFSGVAREVALPGGTEVTAASLNYHRVAGR
jgi:thiamine biosynthesis lipoprotein ApbE